MPAYADVVACFKTSLLELKEDALSANYDAKVASDSLRACQDALASSRVKDSSMLARNVITVKFIDIADVATTQVIT